MMAIDLKFTSNQNPEPPVPDEETATRTSNLKFSNVTGGETYFVSPKGAEHTYGISAPVRIKTVAFGVIPTEVTFEVRQLRTAEGLPQSIYAGTFTEYIYAIRELVGTRWRAVGNRFIQEPLEFANTVELRITEVVVDGIDINLAGQCSTGPQTTLTLNSEARDDIAPANDPSGAVSIDPTDTFVPASGGRLTGTIDIPPLSGCSTSSGDDLSPLLTSAMSSEGNPVTVGVGFVGCSTYGPDFKVVPPAPGENDVFEAHCPFTDSHYPGNPKLTAQPAEIPLPNQAP